MKINEAEQTIGISKKNIRFYEQEGLLKPSRTANGYRDYSQEDITVLQQIKLLRRLEVPIEEIRRLQEGSQTLGDCLERQLVTLKRRRRNLEATELFCRNLLEEDLNLADLPVEELLSEMDDLEKGGMKFMNVREKDRRARKKGALIGAGCFILLMIGGLVSIIWAMVYVSFPLVFDIILLGLPVLCIICTLFVLRERIKEINGGEIDEASKY